jgi:hypothetical protein
MIAKGKILLLSTLLISSGAFASEAEQSNRLLEAVKKYMIIGTNKVVDVVTDKENQEAVKNVVRNGYKKSKTAYEHFTGRDSNKKIKSVLLSMGLARPEDQTIVRDVHASYRHLPELANILAESNVDVYEVSFNQLINNTEETSRKFEKCILMVENKKDRVNYTLSSCSITTKNYLGAPVFSDELMISQDPEQAQLITRQIHDFKWSETKTK